MLLLSSANFFSKINLFKSFIQEHYQSVKIMVWIQIRTNILSVLTWVQTVCKGYQQMTKVISSKVKDRHFCDSHLTIGSSEFLWNCTSLTRVTVSVSGALSGVSGSMSPFKYGCIGGGVTRTASSPYTSWATTSWAWSNACSKQRT